MKGWIWSKGEPDEEHICITCFIIQHIDGGNDFLSPQMVKTAETKEFLHAVIYGGERIVEAGMDTYDGRLVFEEFDTCTHCCAGEPCEVCGQTIPDHEYGCPGGL